MVKRVSRISIRRVFRNDKAVVAWLFVAASIGVLGCFSYLAWRDGGIPQIGRWTWPLLGVFWLFCAGAASGVANLSLLRIELSANGVQVRERFLLNARSARYHSRDLGAPRVERVIDSDGDERFDGVLDLPDGRRVVVFESADRATVQRCCDELLASLRALCRGFSA
ncbi:hypothetical protein [Tahibacter sp.]|uniref:hypothetical protein n=1 Tax=Tahibacter sp. TaxID=2056211 RepID=UPI0028C4FB34|nr:hypothetical protein [Tahibacter sp.]